MNLTWIMPAEGSGRIKPYFPSMYGFFLFMNINIIVNGKAQSISEGASLLTLFKLLDINPGQVAVEYNRDIIDKNQFDSIYLKENDSLEIITFVGGGNG